ncbi:MAG TPA: alpha/beta fold hydrolase [Gemmatimonadaceae bacterium]|nr:alpha/beta fold hydrolase [Gemmatimonadaceae bacterium]
MSASKVVAERAVRGGRELRLTLALAGESVPAVWLLPLAPRPAPAALVLHGYGSRKERMADTIGRALLARGIAALALDLPLHGERAAPDGGPGGGTPLELITRWQSGLAECQAAVRWLEAESEVDAPRLATIGYSMGAFLALEVAAATPEVRAVVLAAGGDFPPWMPFASLIRRVVDPLRAARALGGRPLLMAHGRRDRTVHPDQAQRLFDVAGEPKAIRWWDAGHVLPPAAIDDAAAWLAERLSEERLSALGSRPSAGTQ